MTENEKAGAMAGLADGVAEALAPTERRLEVEGMAQANDAALARLAQQGATIDKTDVLNVRLHILCDTLLGDVDDPRRLDYEAAVQLKFAELVADMEQQLARAKLLQGVRVDPRNGNGRPR